MIIWRVVRILLFFYNKAGAQNIFMEVGIVIPAYNVGHRLHNVLSKALEYVQAHRVYVVDDGSTDATAEVAKHYGVVLTRHGTNRGKGEALKSGFRLVLENGLEGIITLDGDGQHDPDYIPDFIRIMEATPCDIVLGVRCFRIGRMPLDRIFSNLTSSILVSLVVKKWIPDSQSGYRLIRASVLKEIHLLSSYYEIETELLIKALWRGSRISYVPISLVYDDSYSNIRRFVDTKRFCKMVLRLIKDRNLSENG